MKRNPIVIAILVVAMMASASGLTVHAEPGDKAIPAETVARRDTLSLTQEEYMTASHEALAKADGDEPKVAAACETFLALGKAYVRDPKAYDCTVLVAADSMGKNTIQYRLSEYQYLSALYEALGWEILWDDLTFTDFKVSVDGNHATASVVESYRYYVTDGFNSESFRRKMYSFELLCGPSGWRITDVTSNSASESRGGFQYVPIDVKSAVAAQLAEMEQVRSTRPVPDEARDARADIQEGILRTEYPYSGLTTPMLLFNTPRTITMKQTIRSLTFTEEKAETVRISLPNAFGQAWAECIRMKSTKKLHQPFPQQRSVPMLSTYGVQAKAQTTTAPIGG